jgi:hypothetical protein
MPCDSPATRTPRTIKIISHSNGLFTVGVGAVSEVVTTIDKAEARARQLQDEAGGPDAARIVRVEYAPEQGGRNDL